MLVRSGGHGGTGFYPGTAGETLNYSDAQYFINDTELAFRLPAAGGLVLIVAIGPILYLKHKDWL
jgi:hypothetical protein